MLRVGAEVVAREAADEIDRAVHGERGADGLDVVREDAAGGSSARPEEAADRPDVGRVERRHRLPGAIDRRRVVSNEHVLGAGDGFSTSRIATTSGCPYRVFTAAFIGGECSPRAVGPYVAAPPPAAVAAWAKCFAGILTVMLASVLLVAACRLRGVHTCRPGATSTRRGRCRRCRSPCTSRWSASGSRSRRWCCSSSGCYLRTGDALYRVLAQPLVEGDDRAVRRRRRDGHDPVASSSGCCGRTSWRRSATCSGWRSRSRASRSSSRRSSSPSTSTAGTACRRARTCLSGIPVVIAGLPGSLMVIAVNGWMNHPSGFRLVDGEVDGRPSVSRRCSGTATSGTSSRTCTSPATSSPGSSSRPSTPGAALRGRRGRYERTALLIPLTVAALAAPVQVIVGDWAAREVAKAQPVKLAAFEGLGHDGEGARHPRPRLVHGRRGEVRHRVPEAALAAGLPRPERRRCRGSTPCRRRTGRRSTSCGSRSRPWSGSARCSRGLGRRLPGTCAPAPARARVAVVLPGGGAAGPLSVVALIAGWVTTEVGPPAVGGLPA